MPPSILDAIRVTRAPGRDASFVATVTRDWNAPVYPSGGVTTAIGQYLGPGYPIFHAPSVDLSMRFFVDTDDEWALVRSLCHGAGDGYASAEVSMWDRKGRLLAHGNQMMLLRFPDPADWA